MHSWAYTARMHKHKWMAFGAFTQLVLFCQTLLN